LKTALLTFIARPGRQARGPENRLEIELCSGEVIRLRGQGAGRWPTSVSVLGDLHEIARAVLE
jgi:homoserine dehydrogenase